MHAVEVTFAASKSLILLSSGNDRQLLVTPQSIRIHDTLAKDISAMAELLCAVISDPYSPYDDALVKTGLDLKRHADELRRARNEMVFQAIKSAPRSEGQVPVPTRDIDAYSTIVCCGPSDGDAPARTLLQPGSAAIISENRLIKKFRHALLRAALVPYGSGGGAVAPFFPLPSFLSFTARDSRQACACTQAHTKICRGA